MINLMKPALLGARYPRALCCIASLLGLLVTRNAAALVTYPADIKAHLNLNYTPSCKICHATATGGGPITTKFGQAMVAAGLTVNIATLDPALDTLNKNKTDSDGDGIPDIQALQDGIDPNTGGANVPTERYGCGARVSTGSLRHGGELSIALATLGLGLLVHWRRMLNRNHPGR